MNAVSAPHIVVDVDGSGPPALLLHGFTGSAATWSRQLAALGTDHRTIAPDLLGHARSEPATEPARYDLGAQADMLTDLLDRLAIASTDVVGYSLGARLALRLAVEYPPRVGRLVLESPSAGIADERVRHARKVADDALAASLERDGIESFVDAWERQELFASHASLSRADRVELRRERLAHDPAALAAALRGGGQGSMPPLHAALGGIRSPTLVVAGSLDPTGLTRAETVSAALPHARLEVITDAGHMPHLERPDAFAAILTDFLRPDGPPTAGAPS